MKRFVIMIVIVLAISVLWMAGWFYIAGQVRTEIAYLAQADGISQPRLTCESLDVGGAPFSFSPRCQGAQITAADTTISIPDVRGTALFYRPFHIQAVATGPARVTDAFTGAAQEIDWSNLHASLRLAGSAIERFSVVADDLVYRDVLMAETELGTASRGEIHLVDATPAEPAPGTGMIYDFYAMLENVTSEPYDIAQGALAIDGQLTGVPDPTLWGDPDLVAYWQAYDGRFSLRGLDLTAEGLSLSAEGEASLAETGLLNGNLAIESRGISDRIAAIVGDPAVAQIVLGSPDDTGVSRQNLTITNGTVIVGILPIASLPPLF